MPRPILTGARPRTTRATSIGPSPITTRPSSINPQDAQYYSNRAYTKFKKCSLDDSIADYSKAIELSPDKIGYHESRGYVEFTSGHSPEALADLQKVVAASPGNSYYPRYFLLLIAAQKPDQAAGPAKELSDYLHANPGKEGAWYPRIGLFLVGELSEADLLKAAESTDPKIAAARHCKAYFYIGMKKELAGDKPGSLASFQQCLDTNEKDIMEYQVAQARVKGRARSRLCRPD